MSRGRISACVYRTLNPQQNPDRRWRDPNEFRLISMGGLRAGPSPSARGDWRDQAQRYAAESRPPHRALLALGSTISRTPQVLPGHRPRASQYHQRRCACSPAGRLASIALDAQQTPAISTLRLTNRSKRTILQKVPWAYISGFTVVWLCPVAQGAFFPRAPPSETAAPSQLRLAIISAARRVDPNA